MTKIKQSIPAIVKCFLITFLMIIWVQPGHSRTLIFQSNSEGSTAPVAKSSVPVASSQPVSAMQGSTQEFVQPTQPTAEASANAELFFMIEQLQQEVNVLRGMLEEQANELRLLKQSGKDRYLDLDNRILDITKKLNATPVNNVPGTNSSNSDSSANVKVEDSVKLPAQAQTKASLREPTKAENDAYQKAYQYIREKKFDDAILALFNYTESYPDSPLIPNVYYWLGEVYLATSKLEQAKTSFSLVMSAYPDSQKMPDAVYKLAVTLDGLGEKTKAKELLKEVQAKYPDSSAAKLASSYKINQ